MLRYLLMRLRGYRLTYAAGPWRFAEPCWCRLTRRGWRYLPRLRGGTVEFNTNGGE